MCCWAVALGRLQQSLDTNDAPPTCTCAHVTGGTPTWWRRTTSTCSAARIDMAVDCKLRAARNTCRLGGAVYRQQLHPCCITIEFFALSWHLTIRMQPYASALASAMRKSNASVSCVHAHL